jgi:hypothetical protein
LKNRLRLLQEWFTVKNALNGDGRRQMINHRFGRSWIGGNRAGSRAKERKMSNGARHQRSRAGEGSVTGVSSTHTHTLMPLPSSPARPKLRTRTLIPHARSTQRTPTLFSWSDEHISSFKMNGSFILQQYYQLTGNKNYNIIRVANIFLKYFEQWK